jgi:hypothetical protein
MLAAVIESGMKRIFATLGRSRVDLCSFYLLSLYILLRRSLINELYAFHDAFDGNMGSTVKVCVLYG